MSAATAVAIDNEQTNAAAELARLRNFIPLHRLSDSEFDLMMQSASVETMRAGRNLFEAGVDERWMFYLKNKNSYLICDIMMKCLIKQFRMFWKLR